MPGFPAPSSESRNYDALLTSTLANMQGVIADTIGTDDPYLYQLMKKQGGGYEGVSALGERCEVPLMYELGQFAVYEGLIVAPLDLSA